MVWYLWTQVRSRWDMSDQHLCDVMNSVSSPHISEVAYSGGLIRVPSFSLLQKDSSMQTPGYGEAPAGDRKEVILQVKKCLQCGFYNVFCQLQGLPREKISQRRTPKDQTSLCVVYTRSKMVSGAIHFRGSRACWDVKMLVSESLKSQLIIQLCILVRTVHPALWNNPRSWIRSKQKARLIFILFLMRYCRSIYSDIQMFLFSDIFESLTLWCWGLYLYLEKLKKKVHTAFLQMKSSNLLFVELEMSKDLSYVLFTPKKDTIINVNVSHVNKM